jgi:hypothetical protein
MAIAGVEVAREIVLRLWPTGYRHASVREYSCCVSISVRVDMLLLCAPMIPALHPAI